MGERTRRSSTRSNAALKASCASSDTGEWTFRSLSPGKWVACRRSVRKVSNLMLATSTFLRHNRR